MTCGEPIILQRTFERMHRITKFPGNKKILGTTLIAPTWSPVPREKMSQLEMSCKGARQADPETPGNVRHLPVTAEGPSPPHGLCHVARSLLLLHWAHLPRLASFETSPHVACSLPTPPKPITNYWKAYAEHSPSEQSSNLASITIDCCYVFTSCPNKTKCDYSSSVPCCML